MDRVQIRYDELEQIAGTFASEADRTAAIRARLLRQFDVLRTEGWIGAGAEAHFSEMEGLIFPALNDLEHALTSTDAALRRASEMFNAAEQEAAARFRAEGGGLSAGGTAGAGSSAAGSTGPGSSGGGGGLSDFAAVKGGVKFAAGQLIKNPTLIDRFSRLLAGAGRSGAVDDLVSLGRKLRIESGLALGAKVVAGGAGGLIDFAFLPPDQMNAESFGVQATSGLIQGAVTLNPIGAGVMIGNGVVQVGTSAIAFGAEKIGDIFDIDTRGFVDGVNAVKDTLNIDKHVDTVVQGVVDGAQSLIDRIF